MKDFHDLKEPMQFSDLPAYSGEAKFINGTCRPSQNGSAIICDMHFYAKEDKENVLNFYKDALSNNGWKLLYSDTHTIAARNKNRDMCNINVNESRVSKTKSEFEIDFRQIDQQH